MYANNYVYINLNNFCNAFIAISYILVVCVNVLYIVSYLFTIPQWERQATIGIATSGKGVYSVDDFLRHW